MQQERKELTTSRRSRSSVDDSYRTLEERRAKERRDGEWKERRSESPVASLRSHHNWLKAGLIASFVRPGDRVLDACCGSGADVRKFRLTGVKRWDGFDACEARVEEARRRCASEESRRSEKEPAFRATARTARARKVLSGDWRVDYYDCVTCFFAVHYFWDDWSGSEFARGLARLLFRGKGRVILTLPCSREIERRFAASPTGFGNSLYRIEPSSRPGEYRFGLADSVPSETPERTVPVESLIRDFGSAGFECEMALRFEQLDCWLAANPASAALAPVMRPTVPMSPEEKEVSDLYAALVFCRR